MGLRDPAPVRFMEKVEQIPGGCWLWRASTNRDGYGTFGPGKPVRGSVLAHRWSYAHFVGQIPAGFGVLHTCDTPACVNPIHLFLGDQRANVRDSVAKGRWARNRGGEKNGRAVLTREQVADIRGRSRHYGLYAELGREFGVNYQTIRAVILGETWN